jgi:hypothetical protein
VSENRPSRFGRGAPVALATLVGALAGLAFSPVPMLFDAEWLAWTLVAVFAAVGAIIAFVYPQLAASESVEK